MSKQTKGCEDFKNYINAPTKKDPRKSASHDHDKAFEETKAKGSDPTKNAKLKVKGKLEF